MAANLARSPILPRVFSVIRNHMAPYGSSGAPSLSVNEVMERSGVTSRGGAHQAVKRLINDDIISEAQDGSGRPCWNRGGKFPAGDNLHLPRQRSKSDVVVDLLRGIDARLVDIEQSVVKAQKGRPHAR